jgi:methanogenic corrinoid protein MtbC1
VQQALIEQIVEAVLDLDGDAVGRLIGEAFEQDVDLTTVLNDGLTRGLCKLGGGFEKGHVY